MAALVSAQVRVPAPHQERSDTDDDQWWNDTVEHRHIIAV
jgi:hypothetical protein